MKVKDVFYLDPTIPSLRRVDFTNNHGKTSRAMNKLSRAVAAGKLQISTFFGKHTLPNNSDPTGEQPISFAPFFQCLNIYNNSKQLSTKVYRRVCQEITVPPSRIKSILPVFWNLFWSLPLSATQRNITYRL
ncbi:hypothetical protein BY458DRAFT_416287, partial [Sporodiniella umbellata]